MLRTSRGKGHGLLVGSYGVGWHLWAAASGEETGALFPQGTLESTALVWVPAPTVSDSEQRLCSAPLAGPECSMLLNQWAVK